MQFRVAEDYLVRYGVDSEGNEIRKDVLIQVTPDLVGKTVKLPDGELGVVISQEFDDVGLRVKYVPKEEIESVLKAHNSPIILQ